MIPGRGGGRVRAARTLLVNPKNLGNLEGRAVILENRR